MKRQIIILTTALLVATFGIFITHRTILSQEELNSLMLNEVESLAASESWWNRLDYVCVEVTCECILYSYNSNVASKVEDGKGTVAHAWNCTGCGDCGWIVKS